MHDDVEVDVVAPVGRIEDGVVRDIEQRVDVLRVVHERLRLGVPAVQVEQPQLCPLVAGWVHRHHQTSR